MEEADEGTFVPVGANPGEMIVVRAFNEGKRRMAELSETHPRNFSGAGKAQQKSPYRNIAQYYGIEDGATSERSEEPAITAPSAVASAKNFQGTQSVPQNKPQAEKPNAQPQYKIVTEGVQVTGSILSPNAESGPIVVKNTINQRPLKMVNYNLPEQPKGSPPQSSAAVQQTSMLVQQPTHIVHVERAPVVVAPAVVMASQNETKVSSNTPVQVTRPINETAIVEKPVQTQETKTISVTKQSVQNQNIQNEIKTDIKTDTIQISEQVIEETPASKEPVSEKVEETVSLTDVDTDKRDIGSIASSEGNSGVEMVASIPSMEPSPIIQEPQAKTLKPATYVEDEPALTDKAQSTSINVEETTQSQKSPAPESSQINEPLQKTSGEPSAEISDAGVDLIIKSPSEDVTVETSIVRPDLNETSLESVNALASDHSESAEATDVQGKEASTNIKEENAQIDIQVSETPVELLQADENLVQNIITEDSMSNETITLTETSEEAVLTMQSANDTITLTETSEETGLTLQSAEADVSISGETEIIVSNNDSKEELADLQVDNSDINISKEAENETETTENVILNVENDTTETIVVSADDAEFTIDTTNISFTSETGNSQGDTVETTTAFSLSISQDNVNDEPVNDINLNLSEDNVANIAVESSVDSEISAQNDAAANFSISIQEETINDNDKSPEQVSEQTTVSVTSNENLGDSKPKETETKAQTKKNDTTSVGKKSPPRTNKAKFVDSQGGVQARLQRLKQKK